MNYDDSPDPQSDPRPTFTSDGPVTFRITKPSPPLSALRYQWDEVKRQKAVDADDLERMSRLGHVVPEHALNTITALRTVIPDLEFSWNYAGLIEIGSESDPNVAIDIHS